MADEKCYAEVAKGVAFCNSCGARMPKVEEFVPDDAIRCENCGAMVKRGMRFCTSCGKPMVQITVPGAVSASKTDSEAQDRVCPNCGAKVELDDVFCTGCGTKL